MKIRGNRSLGITGKRLAGMVAASAWSLAFAGDSYAVLRHNYLFNSGDGTTVVDSVVGGLNGTAVGGTVDTADSRFVLDGVDNFVNFDGPSLAINTFTELTLELWSSVSPVHEGQYTASVAFGATDASGAGQQYIMMQPTRGGAEGSSGQITNTSAGAEVRVNTTTDLSDGRLHHTVTTITATELSYYVDGVPIGTAPMGATTLANVSTQFAFLGDSVWNGDPILTGALYEFRIYDDAKSATDVADLFAAGCQDNCGDLYLEVDRDTRQARFVNTLSVKDMVVYTLSSASGALDSGGWTSITDTGDSNSGGSVDPNDVWEITSVINTLIAEQEPVGEGADDGAAVVSSIPLGTIWTKSPYEDIQVSMGILDSGGNEVQLSVPVFFVGNNDEPFSRSDFDLDGDIDPSDYLTLRANHLAALGGTLPIDTFALGDLNGDLLNDYQDFRLFKADYIAENSAAAFASMVASLGAVPEPGTFGLLVLGVAAGLLRTRRKRVERFGGNSLAVTNYSENYCTMNRVTWTLPLIALLWLVPAVSYGQVTVVLDDFESYALGPIGTVSNFSGYDPVPSAEIVAPGAGGAGQALQFTFNVATGLGNLNTNVELPFPMPAMNNNTPNLANYTLEFDLAVPSGVNTGWFGVVEVATPGSGPRTQGLNLGAITVGGDYVHHSMSLATMGQPFGNIIDPLQANWVFRLVALGFPPGADATTTLLLDNVRVSIVPDPIQLVVDPTSGRARLRNVSDTPVDLDYYRIGSTNGSLLTANFNGTTGWNSLADQGLDCVNGCDEVGESWDEVVETNSSSQLVEQFLLGATTLGAGQSVSIGAPVDPAILNSQIGTLSLSFGGPIYPQLGTGTVVFADLSGVVGDYNENGIVDAADYTTWRDRLGQPASALPNRDPANSGAISIDDYTSWKNNFGASLGAGSASGAALTSVPEPAAGLLTSLAICLAAGARFPTRKGWA